jgi:two-component sensor histidine kinase
LVSTDACALQRVEDSDERADVDGKFVRPIDLDAWTEMTRTPSIAPGCSAADLPEPAREPVRARWWLRLALIFLVFTVVGLLEAGQNLMMQYLANRPFTGWQALLMGVSDWYIWAALTPFVLLAAQYCPLGQRSWPVSLFLHIVLSVMCATLVVQLMIPVMERVQMDTDSPRLAKPGDVNEAVPPDPSPLPSTFPTTSRWDSNELGFRLIGLRFAVYLLVYWTIVGVGHALAYYRKYREREMHALALESRLSQTQLQMLKMQLQPHFLFNTLNAISALMHQDVELADQMLVRLAQLLRATLESSGSQEVPLKQELEFVELYLEIEQARFGPRLVVNLVADAETMDAAVPNLILQPLVENAVRHGVAPRPETGHIDIRARRENGRLRVEIMDDGPGMPGGPSAQKREGVGLSNARARLQQMYGDAHQFTLANRAGGGLIVTLCVPFREIPGASTLVEPADSIPEAAAQRVAAGDTLKCRPNSN